ncbi:hypothetical protein TrLO_g725 [Triparma laevis f. longispina]|uniref:Uncharacterized protein n=1 Tax=Triparma laevis f. longispina TaxID=1714387 RepID=A0A9W7KZ99_9STRA|nr:hypothetical protein TrLO_g725 [Triparma laevis f. longispina]
MGEKIVPESSLDRRKSVAENAVADFERSIAEKLMKGEASQDIKDQTLRIGLATTEPFVINTHETVAFVVFGKGTSDFIFKVIFTSVPFAALFVALFWVGAITGFLVYAATCTRITGCSCFWCSPL